MNLLPPAIAAALQRAETGLPPGGGLPNPGQQLLLGGSNLAGLLSGSGPEVQPSNLAQMLAGSGPRAGRFRMPASPEEGSSSPGLLPDSVQSLLPDFLSVSEGGEGQFPNLPPEVQRAIPFFLQQQYSSRQQQAVPDEVRLMQSPQATVPVSGPEGPSEELRDALGRRIATDVMKARMNARAAAGSAYKEAPFGLGNGPTGGEQFNFANEPSGEGSLPLGVQPLLGAMPPGEGE